MRARSLLPLLALLLAAAAPPLPPQLSDPSTTEGWIWQQVQAGQNADLNSRCGTKPLDIHQLEDNRWQAPCRRVRPRLLRALLTQPDLADHSPYGVRIIGAFVEGGLDLRDAHVRAVEVWLDRSWIAGNAILSDARLDGLLSFDGSMVEGELNGTRVVIGSYLTMKNAVFGSLVDLRGARVDDQMAMEGARVAGKFDAEVLHVGAGGLLLRKVAFGGPVDLRGAHVDGQMDMEGANVARSQTFDAERVHVGTGGLLLRKVTFGGPVDLRDAHVDGQMDMEEASVPKSQTFDAERLHVGTDFFARSVTFGEAVNLLGLSVGGNLDMLDSRVRELDLEGAAVRDDLLIGGFRHGSAHWLRWDCSVNDHESPKDGMERPLDPCLDLRNAKVGDLQDDEMAWPRPRRITLEGFTYTHLGGLGGEQREDMRKRPIRWWRDWLSRDPVYSAQPYAQLASVLTTAGNRDGAAEIRFYGRDRERSELLRGCTWLQKLGWVKKPSDARPCNWDSWRTWAGLTALQVFVGYGIGAYGFRAVGWALVLALIGVVILLFAPGVRGIRPVRFLTKAPRARRQRSLLWCFGASLHQVLPLVTISQEFSEFFNDPKRERLYPWQHFAFGVLALCGWALGLFVAAAFSGLIQS